MKKFKKFINNHECGATIALVVFIFIVIVALAYAISGLFVWLLGKFIISVFNINYVWTYWHGLATSIVLSVIGNAFKANVTVKQDSGKRLF